MSHEQIAVVEYPLEMSPTIGAISAAMAKAQGEMQSAKKSRENQHFRAKYADLAATWEACRDALSKNGVAVIQAAVNGKDETEASVVTLVCHSSGEWMRSRLSAPVLPPVLRDGKVGPRNAQCVGSALSYLRRYALQAMVGVSSDDDDGAAASGTTANAAPAVQGPSVAEQDALEATYVDAIKALKTAAEFKALGSKMSKVGFDAEHTARLAALWKAGLKAVQTPVTPPAESSPELHATKPEHTNGAAA